MKRRILRTTGAVAAALVLFVLPASSEAARKKFEFSSAWSWYRSNLDTLYSNRYSPPVSSGTFTSSAGQTLSLKAKSGAGVSAALSFFPHPNLGFQVFFESIRPPLEGRNTPFDVSILGSPAPSRTIRYQKTFDWPDTKGDMKQLVFGLDGVVRWPVTGKLNLSLTGGPSLFRVDGRAAYAGYAKFSLVDGSSLALETLELVYKFGPVSRVGYNLGAEIGLAVYGDLILSAEYRIFRSPRIDTALHIRPDTVLHDPIDLVESAMNLGSLRIDPSYSRFSVGMKFQF